MTLIECLAALVISAVLMTALYAVLLVGTRLARSSSAAREARRSVLAVAAVLRAELAGASASAGDLVAISDSALTIRAQRGFGVVCAPPGATSLVLDDSSLSLVRAPDPTKDSLLLFDEGDPRTAADDHWVTGRVLGVRRLACADGAPGTELSVGFGGAGAAPAGVGAPVRLFEVLEYRRYRDAAGYWMMGQRGPASGGGWSATSPIAGPLLPGTGLEFHYLDAAGAPAGTPGAVATIDMMVRGQASGAAGRQESLKVSIAVSGP